MKYIIDRPPDSRPRLYVERLERVYDDGVFRLFGNGCPVDVIAEYHGLTEAQVMEAVRAHCVPRLWREQFRRRLERMRANG